MPFGLFEHLVVSCRLVFVIVRLDVVLPHWVIFKTFPHQDAAEIGMTVEDDSIQIIDLAFLKFRSPPDRGQRGQMVLFGPVASSQAQNDWAVFQFH